MTDLLHAARDAYRRREWPRAYELFAAARQDRQLSADDLHALGDAAWWQGLVDESLVAAQDAYQAYLDAGRPRSAAVEALGIAVSHFLRGEEMVGSGWLGRAQRLVEEDPDAPEHGYVRYILEVEGALEGPDPAAVAAAARQVQEVGRRHGDRSLLAAGILGEGRALLKQGDVAAGMTCLDEAMVAVLTEDLSPEWAGNIYCHLMAACHEVADIDRARRWTEAASRWLATLPAAVLFTGICRVHRSQVLQIAGAWDEAEAEARRVCDDLADISVASAAEAHYQVGEIRRLRGDFDGAEVAYHRARQRGRDPQPGLALLCLAQGKVTAAARSIAAALVAEPNRLARAPLCSAQIEIALTADELSTARGACDELQATAAAYATSGLEAAALHARGALLLTEGHAEAALAALRAAARRWQHVHARYEAARASVLLARSYQALGDGQAAAAELDAAAATFQRLGAVVDARSVARLRPAGAGPDGLTGREAEVLALIAAGHTNREAARTLVLSEKTIARHLSNIFTKINVSTRTEAAAYAFQHGLASPTRD